MPTNKHALIRYQALDRCFCARGKQQIWKEQLEASGLELCEARRNSEQDTLPPATRCLLMDVEAQGQVPGQK